MLPPSMMLASVKGSEFLLVKIVSQLYLHLLVLVGRLAIWQLFFQVDSALGTFKLSYLER